MPDTTASPLPSTPPATQCVGELTANRWADNIRHTIAAHHLAAVARITIRWDPSPRVDVECTNDANSNDLASLLAGSGAVGVRCDDNGLGQRTHTIVIVAIPVHIYWIEHYGRLIPFERGARITGRIQQPDPSAISMAAIR